MLAPRHLIAEYQRWNEQWGAPFGYSSSQRALGLTDLPLVYRARLAGPFSFQTKNCTKYFEYPWVYHQLDHTRNATVLDVGAGITGLQFVLSKQGHSVYCVDPGLADGSKYLWGSEVVNHKELNAAFHTAVTPMPIRLEEAEFSSGSVDYVTWVSARDNVPFGGSVKTLRAAADCLRVGGKVVATVDLFIDVKPFTRRARNAWGANLNLGKLFASEPRMRLVDGTPTQLYGCEGFEARKIQETCSEYCIGDYPGFVQCFVLEKVSD